MTEPTYEFVKGKGWVLQNPNILNVGYISDTAGQIWKVTAVGNKPTKGLRWDALYSYEDHDMKNFEDYLRVNNNACNPSHWSRWENGLTVVYNQYFMYEKFDEASST